LRPVDDLTERESSVVRRIWTLPRDEVDPLGHARRIAGETVVHRGTDQHRPL
jgi:hypothetical protein